MAVHFHESEVVPVPAGSGVARQRLLDQARIAGNKFRLDRIALAPASEMQLSVAAADLAWFQMLAGEAFLRRAKEPEARLTDEHVVFLPPGFKGTIASKSGAVVLLTVVPEAGKLDPALAGHPPAFRLVDWKSEPLLESKHDARKRIYLATPKLFGTDAIRGEMIIYPPRTECPEHHHEGGAHFMYFLRGEGTCFAGGQPILVRQGSVIYYHDFERHRIRNGHVGELIFSEFFVPGAVTTVWVRPDEVCTWLPTGKNIRGGLASRTIREHRVGEQTADV